MIEFAEGVTLVANGLRWTVAGAMNLANHGGDYSNGLLFVNFNQDCSSLSVGTKKGYRLFSLNSVTDGIEEIYYNDKEEVCIVERLFSSSLIAVVTLASPRKLKVRHFKKGTEICSYSYSNSILSVRMNRQRLVVCLEEAIYIHNIRDMKLLHTIKDTPPNPAGLCALSSNSDNCFLAYPGASHTGEVQIFETVAMQAKMMIPAHDGPLAALSFNASGTKLATASEKGTVIRVFSVVDGAKLFEFRRGVKRCVSIYSLAFSPDSLFLSASSNTETVHIFKLEQVKEGPQSGVDLNSATDANSGGWVSWMKQTLTASASYLPTQVAEVFSQGRDFATVHLPFVNVRNICAFIAVHKVLRLMVASADGVLYIYNVDTNMGGDCILVKQHKFDAVGDKINPHGLQMYGPGGAMDQSYANILRGPVKTECVMTGQDACHDAERYRELGAAAEAPPPAILRLNDEEEFPPVSPPIAD